jgi:hypothetical protein
MVSLPEEVFKKLLATRTYKYAMLNQLNHPSFYVKSLIKASNEQIKNQEKPPKKRGRKPKKKFKSLKCEGAFEDAHSSQSKVSGLYKKNMHFFKAVVMQSKTNKSEITIPSKHKKIEGKHSLLRIIETKGEQELDENWHPNFKKESKLDKPTLVKTPLKTDQKSMTEIIFKNIDYKNVSHQRLTDPSNKREKKEMRKKSMEKTQKPKDDEFINISHQTIKGLR